jgi:hypothetical protein
MVIRRLAPLCALALLAACPVPGMHEPAVDLALSVQPQALVPGDTLRLAATVTNPSDEPLALEFGDDCVTKFYMRAEDGNIVHPEDGLWPCRPEFQRIELGPGASHRFVHA